MTLAVEERARGKILEIHVTGKLEKADYQTFVPEVERLIQKHGKVRVLLATHDFQGWDAGAIWEDIKFDLKHFNDIERLAVVGEKKWEEGMAIFCRPFTTAEIRYFDSSEKTKADKWINEATAVYETKA